MTTVIICSLLVGSNCTWNVLFWCFRKNATTSTRTKLTNLSDSTVTRKSLNVESVFPFWLVVIVFNYVINAVISILWTYFNIHIRRTELIAKPFKFNCNFLILNCWVRAAFTGFLVEFANFAIWSIRACYSCPLTRGNHLMVNPLISFCHFFSYLILLANFHAATLKRDRAPSHYKLVVIFGCVSPSVLKRERKSIVRPDNIICLAHVNFVWDVISINIGLAEFAHLFFVRGDP